MADITLELEVITQKAKAELSGVSKYVKGLKKESVAMYRDIGNAQQAITDINKKISSTGKATKSQMAEVAKNVNIIKTSKEALSTLDSRISEGYKWQAKSSLRAKGAQDKLNLALGKWQNELLKGSLSMMFFGMALKRLFDTIWQSSSKVFQDVMHSVEGTVTGFDQLQNSLSYLGFLVGQALEPIAETLAPVVWMFADWVQENQGLVAGILLVVGVLGTLLYILGTIGSAASGIAAISKVFVAIKLAVASLTTTLGIGLLPLIGLIIVAIMAFAVIWNKNLGGIQEAFKNQFQAMKDFVVSIFGNLVSLVQKIFKGDLVGVINEAVAIILKILVYIGLALANGIIFGINVVKDVLFKFVTDTMGLIKWLASGIDAVFGSDLASGMERAIQGVDRVRNSLQIPNISADYVSPVYKEIDQHMGTGTQVTNANTINVTIENGDMERFKSTLEEYGVNRT